MISSIDEEKIPQGFSFALKTSQLEAALAGIPQPVTLHYRSRSYYRRFALLSAQFHAADSYLTEEACHVYHACVPTSEKAAAVTALAETVIPAFADWLRDIAGLPDGSTRFNEHPMRFEAVLDGNGIKITKS